jgi:hypothetical protein
MPPFTPIGGLFVQKHILAVTLTSLLIVGAHAQEQTDSRRWTLTSSLTTGGEERLNCTLVFPTEEGKPQLRISMANQRDPARMTFELRGVGALAAKDQDKVADVGLTIGSRTIEDGLEATWRESNEGRISFRTTEPGGPLLEPIARSVSLTVKAGDNSYEYDLTGSLRAINELRKCLR